MTSNRFRSALESEPTWRPPKKRGYLTVVGVAGVVVLVLLVFEIGPLLGPSAGDSETVTSATYSIAATSVVDSASKQAPSGYAVTSSRPLYTSEPGLENAGNVVLATRGGSQANMTVLVFTTPSSAQDYMNRVVAEAKGLSGYTDISSVLRSYQRYGACYGFGQDNPFGVGAVATGVCTKGNVYIQVHLATASTLSSSEGDLSGFVGAAYQSIG